jgi:hypothetical protein
MDGLVPEPHFAKVKVGRNLKRVTSLVKSGGPRKKADNGVGSINDELCRRCYNIRWQQICNKPTKNLEGRFVAHLIESRKQLEESSCRVCRLLATLKPDTLDSVDCTLRLYPLRVLFPASRFPKANTKLQPALNCCVLGAAPSKDALTPNLKGGRFLDILNENDLDVSRDYGPQLVSSRADFGWITKCIEFCRGSRSHQSCSAPEGPPVRGFQLIELPTMSIVAAENLKNPYVALSYVWGQDPGPDWREGIPQDELRHVVRDSIDITKKLGYKYIWIDRYVSACLSNLPNRIKGVASITGITRLTL